MTRTTQMPSKWGCIAASAPRAIFSGKRKHRWEWSSLWNGNNREVLPFTNDPHGIARSGWRCYHCGRFIWDESDQAFAAAYAVAVGIVKLPKKPRYRVKAVCKAV